MHEVIYDSGRIAALEQLADVVRKNVGRKMKRSNKASPMTRRLDSMRDALCILDRFPNQETRPVTKDRVQQLEELLDRAAHVIDRLAIENHVIPHVAGFIDEIQEILKDYHQRRNMKR